MLFKKIILLLLLLVVTISLSFLIGSLFEENIFNINSFGFYYLVFSVLGSFVYFSFKYLKKYDQIIIVIFTAATYGLLMRKTNFAEELGSITRLGFYALLLFSIYTIIFNYTWYRLKYLRNILFSIFEALGFVLAHLIIHVMIKRPIRSQFILIYFLNGLKVMIALGASFSIVEFLFAKLEDLFFGTPQRILPKENEQEDIDQ